ncbi:MAG: RtcB family protein [Candidatus Bipolaricaulia bacterium]
MNLFDRLERVNDVTWVLAPHDGMNVPGRIYADPSSIDQLRHEAEEPQGWSALRQLKHVASLPGIVAPALALPDVHPGYGFPIGGVGAFDADDGVVVVGGVGFDINCGVRLMRTPLRREDVLPDLDRIAAELYRAVPAGLGSQGALSLPTKEIDRVLREGAGYVVDQGMGLADDLEYTEEGGRVDGADPGCVSPVAKQRQLRQLGTLGSGNHYLELQSVDAILDPEAARAFGVTAGQIVVSIHTGSRALGHQIGQDYLREMAGAPAKYGIRIPDQEMVCAPIRSTEGARYLAAVACGTNCAFANRQAIAHWVRMAMARLCGMDPATIQTVYDIGHNHVKFESHVVAGVRRRLLVHRKGSTRAFGPGHADIPAAYRSVGHPTLVGGTMGTASYIMRGTEAGTPLCFSSGIHGAGRALSRNQAVKRFRTEQVLSDLASAGIRLLAHDRRGVAEEAPGAYKDVERVVRAAEAAGINVAVARLRPLVVVKG